MRRVATSTAALDLHGVGKSGFTSGNKQAGIFPTEIGAEWCNGIQEEICNCIELSQQTPDVDDDTQLARGIPYLAWHNTDPLGNDVIFEMQSEETPAFAASFQTKTDTLVATSTPAVTMCFFTPPNLSSGSVEYTVVVLKANFVSPIGTVQFRQEWSKTAGGLANGTSGAVVIYDKNTIFLNFTYALIFTGGNVALSVTPGPLDGVIIDYHIAVKGEIIILQQT